jgi:trimethylamine---corrinoid protein Co-methyltransferase
MKGTMNVNQYLTPEQTQRIHEESINILQKTGILVRNQKALDIFSKRGCQLDGDVVKFPTKVIEETVKQFSPTFTFRAQDPSKDITIPDEGPIMVTGSSAPNIIDPKTGTERAATSKDIGNIAHLINHLDGFDVFSISTLADDAKDDQFSMYRFYPALKNCAKPVRSNTPTISDLEKVLKMAEIIAGSKAAYQERPFITHHYCPMISPLSMDFESTEAVIYLMEKKLPTYCTFVPTAGMTSPLSLLSGLTVGNAEFLALAVLAHAINPGTSLIYAVLSTMADMRTGDYATGAIETSILQVAHSQMAQFYNIPSGGYIGLTDSHCNDAQSGYETGLNLANAVNGGIDMMNAGGLLSSLMVFDFAKAVIDNEIALMVKKMKKGINFKEEDFLIDLVAEGGHGAQFMGHPHTFKNARKVSFFPKIAVRGLRSNWEKKNSTTAHDRAMKEAAQILSKPCQPSFSDETDQNIKDAFPGLIPENIDPTSF